MAKSKDDITYGTAQAKLSEDESLRVAYKHGTPLEAGKIAESETVDLFSSAHNNIPKDDSNSDQSQLQRDDHQNQENNEGGSIGFSTGAPVLPKKSPPSVTRKY